MTAAPAAQIRRALLARLREHADPERATGQQAYMKSAMPCLGVLMRELRRAAKATFKARPLENATQWQAVVLDLWRRAKHREERYAAIELADYAAYRDYLTPDAMPLLEEMIVTGAWWDYVDSIAIGLVGRILKSHPGKLKPLLRRWARDDDIWRRRTAMLAQLKFKADTDEALLFRAIEASMDESEFFLRKGIGWALREYSKTRPDAVVAFVEKHKERLSGLSKREALKVLLKRGVVQEVP